MNFLRATLLWLACWCIPITFGSALVFFIVTLPARRREKLRLLLNLVLTGLRDGRSPEQTLVAVATLRDRSVGARFHLLAARVEAGEPFVQAIGQVPGLVTTQIVGFLRAGAATGRFQEALAAALGSLGRDLGKTATLTQYGFALLLLVLPFGAVMIPLLRTMIWPRFEELLASMEVPAPALSGFLLDHGGWIFLGYFSLVLFLAFFFVFLVAAPWAFSGRAGLIGLALDRLACALPWQKKRLQRDFSIALALLLEAGMPEPQALRMAADATGNRVFRSRAERGAQQLAQGLPLGKALAAFDPEGQLAWRLVNALSQRKGFLPALRGWHETLEGQAFRLEESAAQVVTTLLLIANGTLVGTVMVSVFMMLLAVLNEGVSW